jgi:hypothetical protein
MRSHRRPGTAGGVGWLAGFALAACGGCASAGGPPPAAAPEGERAAAYSRLIAALEPFEVTGGVRTHLGQILPETISIEIRSEICVESRAAGARFWSLDYDTCFVWVSRDSADADGTYSVSVPCLDADRTYQSQHSFGELRLVQRGPVTYLAESDAGWKMQDTFASSRSQRRDLVLELDTQKLFIVGDDAVLLARPKEEAPTLARYPFGATVEVLRFQQGWAECLKDGRIGWIEMRHLGTEEEMKGRAPFRSQTPLRGIDRGSEESSP